jgi:hypothetical protein
MCSGYDGEIVPSSRTLERSKTVVGCTWSVSSNSPNILNWPLKSYLALLSIAKLQFPGTFQEYQRPPYETNMDAYPMSHTSPSRRHSSRIYQDLARYRLSNRACTDVKIQQLVVDFQSKVCHLSGTLQYVCQNVSWGAPSVS